jgi:hypothetical protein
MPLCPISERYRAFASSQAPGNADRFLAVARHLSTIRSSGRRRCVPGQRAAQIPGGRLHDGTNFRFQALGGGNTACPPNNRPANSRLFPAAPLARRRVEVPATPGVSTPTRNTRDPVVIAGSKGLPFCRPLAREGLRATKPPHPRQAGLIPEPGASRERRGSVMLADEGVRACRGRARMGCCRSILEMMSAVDRCARVAWSPSRARL